MARYRALKLPSYWAGINVEVSMTGSTGNATAAYPRDAVRQYLQYGAMYDRSITVPAR